MAGLRGAEMSLVTEIELNLVAGAICEHMRREYAHSHGFPSTMPMDGNVLLRSVKRNDAENYAAIMRQAAAILVALDKGLG